MASPAAKSVKRLFDPDLVALENAGIALDRLHQRAGFTLLGGAALAEAAATQSRSELVDALGRRREIVLRVKIGVHRQIDLDPLEPRYHAGEGADMLSETRHRRARRYRPISAAGHHELGAGAKLDRLPVRGAGSSASCCRRSDIAGAGHVMFCDGRAHQVEADDVIAQIGAKSARDRFRDFNAPQTGWRFVRSGLRASGDIATARAGPRSRNPLISRLRIMRSNRQVQQALSPGLNTGPTSGKTPEGCTSSQRVLSDTRCRFSSASCRSR